MGCCWPLDLSGIERLRCFVSTRQKQGRGNSARARGGRTELTAGAFRGVGVDVLVRRGSRRAPRPIFPAMAAWGGRQRVHGQRRAPAAAWPSTAVGHPPGATTELGGAGCSSPPPPLLLLPPPSLSLPQFLSELFCSLPRACLNFNAARCVWCESLGMRWWSGKVVLWACSGCHFIARRCQMRALEAGGSRRIS